MRTRIETLIEDIETLDRLHKEQMQLECFDKGYVVPDETQSEIRMLFNEAICGGPNMNGDGGPTLTHNHALDCIIAARRIDELDFMLSDVLKNIRTIQEFYKTGIQPK